MAFPLGPGLDPAETAFLCEMELVTVIPRQRLESLELLSGSTPALKPPHRANLPLWLALLLKRQRRASIVPPPWLHPSSLQDILDREMSTTYRRTFTPGHPLPARPLGSRISNVPSQYIPTPPFLEGSSATALNDALPYHYLELSQLLLMHCSDDIPEVEQVQKLLRAVREVRMAKVRDLVPTLDGGAGSNLTGIGALELAESRAFLCGVVDGLKRLGASREAAVKERIDEDDMERVEPQDDDGSIVEL